MSLHPITKWCCRRKHRHIVDMSLCFLSKASMPTRFWYFAFVIAAFLINPHPSFVFGDKSPFEVLFLSSPDYSFLRVFGCACYPLLRPYNSNKLQSCTTQCLFLGYPLGYKGYLCYDPKHDKFYISRNVTFDEHLFHFLVLA